MAKINTEIIKKDYSVNRVAVQSSYIAKEVFVNLVFSHSGFLDTLLINNKSNTFIKNTTFDYNGSRTILTNIDILNVNQSKLNGLNITISNLNNTFIVNTDNSQSNIKSLQLSSSTLYQSRNQDQSFFNFPAPAEAKDFTVQPMMISNGERTIWSEGKYGWINNADNLTSLENLPHDLYGQNLTANLTDSQKLINLSGLHNGSIVINGSNTLDTVTLKDCSIKITLNGFKFERLNVLNCTTVYLNDCSFDKESVTTLILMNYDINPWQFKQGNFTLIYNCCLSSSNSKIFIKNKTRNLNFNNFFVGIHANNNSLIYMIPLNNNVGILLKENLSNYRENKSTRPIFMLASNGSTINCNYHVNNLNAISANIKYPDSFNGYKGNENLTFIISKNLMFELNGNHTRAKSLIISLFSELNNSTVNFSLNKTYDTVMQSENISVPLFGLYQVAKPKLNDTGVGWQLANSKVHYLSGTVSNHISALGNDEYTLNIYHNGKITSNAEYFGNYNCPSANNNNINFTKFPYSGSQPHLAHYYLKLPLTYETVDATFSITPNIELLTILKQDMKNITTLKLADNHFIATIDGNNKNVYINPINNNFYIFDESDNIIDVTSAISSNLCYVVDGKDITSVMFDDTQSFVKTITLTIKNKKVVSNFDVYYDPELCKFYYKDGQDSYYDIDSSIKANMKIYYNANDITDVYNYSKKHFTTYSTALSSNVDVYYDKDHNKFYYWSNGRHEDITVDTFSLTVANTYNEYFCNGSIDITNIVNNLANKFTTYVDGENRKVFYDYESKDFYYINDDTTSTIVTDQIILNLHYVYNSTSKCDISDVLTSSTKSFPANLPVDGVKEIYYDSSTLNFYYKDGTTNIFEYGITLPKLSGVITDFINKTKAVYGEEGDTPVSTYYFLTTGIDITNILANTFNAEINGKKLKVYYNNDDNTFIIKDKDNKCTDVTDQIISAVSWKYNNTDISNLYKYPNCVSTLINNTPIFYDDSTDILYTPEETIKFNVKPSSVDDSKIWTDGTDEDALDYDLTEVMNNCFEMQEGNTVYNIFHTKLRGFVRKSGSSWTDVNSLTSNLNYYYDGLNINELIGNETQTLLTEINGQTLLLSCKYENNSLRFYGTIDSNVYDFTPVITGDLEVYYEDENIVEVMYDNNFFKYEQDNKEVDIYYNVVTDKFYLNKTDKTAEISSNITCWYNNEQNITYTFNTATSFEGWYVNDDGEYIGPTTISYSNGMWTTIVDEIEEDITDNIESRIRSQQIITKKLDVSYIKTNPISSFNGLVNIEEKYSYEDIYWDSTNSALYFNVDEEHKLYYPTDFAIDILLDNVENKLFYYEDLDISNMINGNSFPIEVIREMYYDNVFNAYVYNNTFGLRIDVTDQISPDVSSNIYYGNLLDISENVNRQYFTTYVQKDAKILNVYYDSYGGKTKKLGVFYIYDKPTSTPSGTNKNSSILNNVRTHYYYEGKDITDTVVGGHFYWNKSSVTNYTIYYDQLTGRYYYTVSGDVKKLSKSIDTDSKILTYDYKGKLDLTKNKQRSSTISTFYSFLDGVKTPQTKFTFKINKDNVLTIKRGSTAVNSLPTEYINGHYYVNGVNIKRVVFNSNKWFSTPIDGISRVVKYQKWTKKLGQYNYYYKVGSKKIYVTDKILSNTDFYYNGEDINKAVKGTYFNTRFENYIEGKEAVKVYYDQKNKQYYYNEIEYLSKDHVASSIYVDITNASIYSKKWDFLAYVDNSVQQLFYDRKKNYYYYLDSKKKPVQINDVNEIYDNLFTTNGDDRNYYHNLKLSSYLMWDNYLKVKVGDHIYDVYKNPLFDEEEDPLQLSAYYYVTKKVIVNHLVEPLVEKKYIYDGQQITDSVYPCGYVRFNLSNYKDYKYAFSAFITDIAKNKKIYYSPYAGFYYASDVVSNTKLAGASSGCIVHDEICKHLNYYYYDRDTGVENDITRNINSNLPFQAVIDDLIVDVCSKFLESEKYNIKTDKNKDNIYQLHKRQFYYKNGLEEIDITSAITPSFKIKYWSSDITRVVEDGLNYFVTMYKGTKRYVYYNPARKSWYYYKNNSYKRIADNKFIKAITDQIIQEKDSNGDIKPKYYSYTQNISNILSDTKNKLRFIGYSKEDVFYDPNTREFFYYTNLLLGLREVVTPYIQPNITNEYKYYIEGKCYDDLSKVMKGEQSTVSLYIEGIGYVLAYYDIQTGTFSYTTVDGEYANVNLLTDIHNSVEMVCSNINNANINDSKLYLNVYKLKV